ncbi:MAG: N-acetylmuramoyl-L-alanine amidase, partial [Rhodospirillales bacterium]
IDPGHGGADPGAIGVSGVHEKDVTLAAARDLRSALERLGGYRVVLTRDDDRSVSLRERIAIARRVDADLFVSLHADAMPSAQVRGASVYTLSETASDAEAALLAERENKADLITGVDLTYETAEVANILIDLAQRETKNRSARLAARVVDELQRETQLLRNTHRFAGFAVLKAPDVPSVLVELGFLSNRQDEQALRDTAYRRRLAAAIARGIDRYFVGVEQAALR